ncbi:MAG: helix-turn-helix domain-containing protein [Acidobacteriota bacterium]
MSAEKAVRRTRKIDKAKYQRLLAKALPTVIDSDAEYERVDAEIGRLLRKGDDLSWEEVVLLNLLTLLIEHYDTEHYQIRDAKPYEVIRYLMRDRGLRNRDLQGILGSRGVTSEVINGRRRPSKSQILALSKFFGVEPEVFLSL